MVNISHYILGSYWIDCLDYRVTFFFFFFFMRLVSVLDGIIYFAMLVTGSQIMLTSLP